MLKLNSITWPTDTLVSPTEEEQSHWECPSIPSIPSTHIPYHFLS